MLTRRGRRRRRCRATIALSCRVPAFVVVDTNPSSAPATSSGTSQSADTDRLLRIYLADHRAGAAAGLARVQRFAAANAVSFLADDAAAVCRAIEHDVNVLDEIIDRLECRPSRSKMLIARAAEFIGRLKPERQAAWLLAAQPADRIGGACRWDPDQGVAVALAQCPPARSLRLGRIRLRRLAATGEGPMHAVGGPSRGNGRRGVAAMSTVHTSKST